MAVAANETPRIELLEENIKVMLDEVTRLRDEAKKLRAENHAYKSRVARLENHIEASEKEEKEELAFYITNHRQALNISRDKLAVICKVSDATIRNMEHGEGNLLKMRELVKVIQGLRRV